MSIRWQIILTATAKAHLAAITDARVRKAIAQRIDELREKPEQRGKPLTGPLAHYYSVRAVGQRYRIIYQLEHERIIVVIVALGIRKEGDRNDMYTLAQRLLRQGSLTPPTESAEEQMRGFWLHTGQRFISCVQTWAGCASR